MINIIYVNIFKKLFHNQPKNILLLTHPDPDGDAVGSVLSLFLYLKKYNHNLKIIITTNYSKNLEWIPNINNIQVCNNNRLSFDWINFIKKINYIFFLDFNKYSRIKEFYNKFLKNNLAIKILIDHHLCPDKFDINISLPKYSSTTHIIYDLIKNLKDEKLINKKIASLLYIGIVTDTGYFSYSDINTSIYKVIHNLCKTKFDIKKINHNLSKNYSIEKLKILGKILHNINILKIYNTVYMIITRRDIEKYSLHNTSFGDYVNFGLKIKNIVLSVLFIEINKNIIKISFRSCQNLNVNKIAKKYFNGGGHKYASGAIYKNNLKNTIEYFLFLIKKQNISKY